MKTESEHVQALRDRYKSSFTEKTQLIAQHLNSLLDEDAQKSTLMDEIRNDLHKLAGSLGMYGYDEMAEVARAGMAAADGDSATELEQELLSLKNLFEQDASS